jgi:hypothetical protein
MLLPNARYESPNKISFLFIRSVCPVSRVHLCGSLAHVSTSLISVMFCGLRIYRSYRLLVATPLPSGLHLLFGSGAVPGRFLGGGKPIEGSVGPGLLWPAIELETEYAGIEYGLIPVVISATLGSIGGPPGPICIPPIAPILIPGPGPMELNI